MHDTAPKMTLVSIPVTDVECASGNAIVGVEYHKMILLVNGSLPTNDRISVS